MFPPTRRPLAASSQAGTNMGSVCFPGQHGRWSSAEKVSSTRGHTLWCPPGLVPHRLAHSCARLVNHRSFRQSSRKRRAGSRISSSVRSFGHQSAGAIGATLTGRVVESQRLPARDRFQRPIVFAEADSMGPRAEGWRRQVVSLAVLDVRRVVSLFNSSAGVVEGDRVSSDTVSDVFGCYAESTW